MLPATIQRSFQGTAQAFQQSFANLGLLLVAAIVVIYIVLGILYQSFIHPLTILSSLPSAGLGGLVTLILFHEELNLYSFVGIIMLVGIVKKNVIMMIDFALENECNKGETREESIYQGAWSGRKAPNNNVVQVRLNSAFKWRGSAREHRRR